MGLQDGRVEAAVTVSDLRRARRFDSGSFRAAWVKDPDGNTLALTQPYG